MERKGVLLAHLILLVSMVGLSVLVTSTVQVVAETNPVAIFTYSPEHPLINETVIFNASASYDPNGYIISYEWNFGDGSDVIIIEDPITSHEYKARGSYNVTLKVTDNEAKTGKTWSIVTVIEHPVANFTYSPAVPLVNEVVTFNASLSTPNGGSITSYRWYFGDLTPPVTESDPITTHAYSAKGNYTVTLTITDSEGLTDTCSKSIKIIKHPIAVFTYSPAVPLVNEVVTFNASLSTPNGGSITSYKWNFGDGKNGTGMIVTNTYTAYGTYNVTLNITDSEGLSDTAWSIVTVIKHPVAVFTYSPFLPLVNTTVTFNASLSTPNGGSITSYAWNFRDGQYASGKIVTHIYKAYGTYNVTLTVTDSEGLSDTCFHLVKVPRPPTADFTYSPINPVKNEKVTFNASVSYDLDGTITSYKWNFGDGKNGTGMIVNHTYTAAGTYNVTLTVTDSDNLTDSISKIIAVYTFRYTHDVAVISVTTSPPQTCLDTAYPTWKYTSSVLRSVVTVKNNGNGTETFTVTVCCGNIVVGTKTVLNLAPGAETTITLEWQPYLPGYPDNPSAAWPYPTYTIKANATVHPREVIRGDNELVNGTITVKWPGDANGDGIVSFPDLSLLASYWFNTPTYNPAVDFNMDGLINLSDLSILATNWFKGPLGG